MRGLISIFTAISLIFCGFAQDDSQTRFYSENSILYHLGIGQYKTLAFNGGDYFVSNEEHAVGISSHNGIKINNHQLGLGAGIDLWSKAVLFPVGFHYKYADDAYRLSPLGFLNVGYAFGNQQKTIYTESAKGNFFLKAGTGFQLKRSEKFIFSLEISCKLQSMSSYYYRIIDPNQPKVANDYYLFYHFIGLQAGIQFR